MSGSAMMFHMAPTTFHGMSSGSAISTRQTDTQGPLRGMASAMARPSGISMARTMAVNRIWRSSAAWKRLGVQDLLEPAHARPEEDIVAEGFLDRVVDDRHQRDDGVERHQRHHRQDEEPARFD